jgi:hypothetical protein
MLFPSDRPTPTPTHTPTHTHTHTHTPTHTHTHTKQLQNYGFVYFNLYKLLLEISKYEVWMVSNITFREHRLSQLNGSKVERTHGRKAVTTGFDVAESAQLDKQLFMKARCRNITIHSRWHLLRVLPKTGSYVRCFVVLLNPCGQMMGECL